MQTKDTISYERRGYLTEDFRLFHLKNAQKEKIDYHYHEFYKLLFLISGTGNYFVEGKRYLLKSGDIVLIGKHCVHRPEFESEAPYERVIFYISPDWLEESSMSDCDFAKIFSGKHGHVLRPDEHTKKLLASQMAALDEEVVADRYGKKIVSRSMLLRLIVELERGFRYGNGKKLSHVVPESRQMQEMVKYLDSHLTEDISIEELSERFYLSRFHMMRRFKEETGMTIHSYLSERRLFLAREMISQGQSSTDACFASGFRSYASFARAYGKLFGMTPTGRKSAAMAEIFE